MARRLPTVYYAGFKQDFIPQYIKKHKQTHPYFLKIDLQKFYPSLSHHHLCVQAQIAYKELLGVFSLQPSVFSIQYLVFSPQSKANSQQLVANSNL